MSRYIRIRESGVVAFGRRNFPTFVTSTACSMRKLGELEPLAARSHKSIREALKSVGSFFVWGRAPLERGSLPIFTCGPTTTTSSSTRRQTRATQTACNCWSSMTGARRSFGSGQVRNKPWRGIVIGTGETSGNRIRAWTTRVRTTCRGSCGNYFHARVPLARGVALRVLAHRVRRTRGNAKSGETKHPTRVRAEMTLRALQSKAPSVLACARKMILGGRHLPPLPLRV